MAIPQAFEREPHCKHHQSQLLLNLLHRETDIDIWKQEKASEEHAVIIALVIARPRPHYVPFQLTLLILARTFAPPLRFAPVFALVCAFDIPLRSPWTPGAPLILVGVTRTHGGISSGSNTRDAPRVISAALPLPPFGAGWRSITRAERQDAQHTPPPPPAHISPPNAASVVLPTWALAPFLSGSGGSAHDPSQALFDAFLNPDAFAAATDVKSIKTIDGGEVLAGSTVVTPLDVNPFGYGILVPYAPPARRVCETAPIAAEFNCSRFLCPRFPNYTNPEGCAVHTGCAGSVVLEVQFKVDSRPPRSLDWKGAWGVAEFVCVPGAGGSPARPAKWCSGAMLSLDLTLFLPPASSRALHLPFRLHSLSHLSSYLLSPLQLSRGSSLGSRYPVLSLHTMSLLDHTSPLYPNSISTMAIHSAQHLVPCVDQFYCVHLPYFVAHVQFLEDGTSKVQGYSTETSSSAGALQLLPILTSAAPLPIQASRDQIHMDLESNANPVMQNPSGNNSGYPNQGPTQNQYANQNRGEHGFRQPMSIQLLHHQQQQQQQRYQQQQQEEDQQGSRYPAPGPQTVSHSAIDAYQFHSQHELPSPMSAHSADAGHQFQRVSHAKPHTSVHYQSSNLRDGYVDPQRSSQQQFYVPTSFGSSGSGSGSALGRALDRVRSMPHRRRRIVRRGRSLRRRYTPPCRPKSPMARPAFAILDRPLGAVVCGAAAACFCAAPAAAAAA
ncbi:hypothetical protein BKA62DRAFT_758302, partial [Auriculariales sp. MPI-PUGE-AT-0066]